MTGSSNIVRLADALPLLIRAELDLCRARWGENFQLLCLERNWGEALDDRQVLRLARLLNRDRIDLWPKAGCYWLSPMEGAPAKNRRADPQIPIGHARA